MTARLLFMAAFLVAQTAFPLLAEEGKGASGDIPAPPIAKPAAPAEKAPAPAPAPAEKAAAPAPAPAPAEKAAAPAPAPAEKAAAPAPAPAPAEKAAAPAPAEKAAAPAPADKAASAPAQDGKPDPVKEDELVKQALLLFKEKKMDEAKARLDDVQTMNPLNGVAAFYLGEIALEKGDLKEAANQWQLFSEVDPAGAEENDIPRRLTVLKKDLRGAEMKRLLDEEEKLTKAKPVKNSIAVFPFVNTGDKKYDVMAKGLAALVIADLAKVPGLTVLERENVQTLMDEIKLSQSGLVRKDAEVKAGRLLRAEKVMTGTYNIK